jgi:GAF domain-containing protein
MSRGRADGRRAEGLPDTIVIEARIVGLRDFTTLSLEAVEHRRIQLWILTSIMLVSVSIGVVVLSIWPSAEGSTVSSGALRWGIVLMSIGFCAYTIDKERHLQKLSRLLTDERVLTAALSNRLRELSLLLQAGKAMNAVLELDAVLDVILHSALELLAGTSGSIMLVDGEALVARCVRNNPDALGRRVAIGEGISGRVARTKEPLLINGKPTPQDFPGLDARTQQVASAMSVPLVNRDQLLGVLNVNAEPGSAFSAYDLRALSLFAEQAAVAIANARLFDAERAHVVELVELDRLKSEFLGLVTHELRTPLTVVLAAAQAGKQPDSPIETSELFEIIERNSKDLASLIEELLIAARLEQGEASAGPVTVDLAELARTVARDFGVTDRRTPPAAGRCSASPCRCGPRASKRSDDRLGSVRGAVQREQDDLSDARDVREEHQEPVDPDPEPAGRRHPVFERLEEILVERMGLQLARLARPLLEQELRALLVGIRELGVPGPELHPADHGVHVLGEPGVVAMGPCQR